MLKGFCYISIHSYWKLFCTEFLKYLFFFYYCYVGIALGFILKIYVPMTDVDRLYISFPGEILINMLQALTVPLIVTSVIISKQQDSVNNIYKEHSGVLATFKLIKPDLNVYPMLLN